VGLAQALDRLDDARSAPGGGHIDDLDALVLVARAHPDAADFELWLRQRLRLRPSRETRGRTTPPPPPEPDDGGDWMPAGWAEEAPGMFDDGPAPNAPDPVESAAPPLVAPGPNGRVTLSTVHRVKGLEWPHVVVWDVSDGVMPHRLNTSGPDLEEERRVFHVAITRARRSAVVLARAGAPSRFLAEMAGEAPHTAPESMANRVNDAAGRRREARGDAAPGGGHDAAERLRQRRDRRNRQPDKSVELDEAGTRRANALREWRRKRSKDDGVPAYVVLNDRHLDGIAHRAPTTLDELALCDGIGPTKLDRYGDDILTTLESLD
jgi:hypothetical protein